MQQVKVKQKVRTNRRYRNFFKTQVVKGMVVASWYDSETWIIRRTNGAEIIFHQDWLETDTKKMRDERR